MLHPFVSVPNASRNLTPVLVLSASVHAGLLYAALTTTGVVRRPYVPPMAAELVRFAELPARRPPPRVMRQASSGDARRGASDASVEFTLPQLPASFDLMLPDAAPLPDFAPELAVDDFGGSGVSGDDALRLGLAAGGPRLPGAGPYAAYDEAAVERTAMPAPDNRRPRYPSRLIGRGIETRFNVTFVVDTSGGVDQQTVELPRSVEEEFTSAVAEVLSSWRFIPAQLGGRRVRQRVLQPFMFRVERGYGAYGRW
jgi:protein TonB